MVVADLDRITAMNRMRNPRYAPDWLERRLSPSSFALAPSVAEVSTFRATTVLRRAEAPLPTDVDGDPIPEPTSGDEPGHNIPV
jgi:hypothetical protein